MVIAHAFLLIYPRTDPNSVGRAQELQALDSWTKPANDNFNLAAPPIVNYTCISCVRTCQANALHILTCKCKKALFVSVHGATTYDAVSLRYSLACGRIGTSTRSASYLLAIWPYIVPSSLRVVSVSIYVDYTPVVTKHYALMVSASCVQKQSDVAVRDAFADLAMTSSYCIVKLQIESFMTSSLLIHAPRWVAS